jgi:hypothetical protein
MCEGGKGGKGNDMVTRKGINEAGGRKITVKNKGGNKGFQRVVCDGFGWLEGKCNR